MTLCKKVLVCPVSKEKSNDKQPDSLKGGEMELKRQTSEHCNVAVDIDRQTDEYDNDSDSEPLTVNDHEDEKVFLHAVQLTVDELFKSKLFQVISAMNSSFLQLVL